MSEPELLPPRRAERLLEAIGADPYLCEVVLGDLAEEFAARVEWDGEAAARRWYRRECVRVMPFLVRDRLRRLHWADLTGTAGGVALAVLAVVAFETAMRFATRFVVLTALPSGGVAALMLAWTSLDGLLGGYVAARLGRHAPLASAVAFGTLGAVMMVVGHGGHAPLWFRVANVIVLLTSVCVGAVVHVWGRGSDGDRMDPVRG